MNSKNLIVLRKENSHLIEDSVSDAICFEEGDELSHFFFLWLVFVSYVLSIYTYSSVVKYFLEKIFDFFLHCKYRAKNMFLLTHHNRGYEASPLPLLRVVRIIYYKIKEFYCTGKPMVVKT